MPPELSQSIQDTRSLFASSRLLGQCAQVQARDISEAHGHIEPHFGPHHLSSATRNAEVRLTHRQARLGSLTFNALAYGADVDVHVDRVDRPLFLLMIPLEGEAEIVQGTHHSHLARGNFVVIDPREIFELNLDAAQRHLTVGIPPDALKRALALRGEDSSRMAFSRRALEIDGPGETLMRFTDFLCEELDRPQIGALAPQVATTLEDSFLQMFIAGALEENETDLQAMPRSVRVAQRFMLAHLKQPISVSDVAAAADVSERTLRAHFASACGTRPGNRLLQLRLEQARHDLMGTGSATNSVTEVALRYCFGNVGRFARHYRDIYGENPSRTLARTALHPPMGRK